MPFLVGHLDQHRRGERAFRKLVAGLVRRLPFAQRDAERKVARLRRRAGQHEVAEAGQAGQGFRPRTERAAEARPVRQSRASPAPRPRWRRARGRHDAGARSRARSSPRRRSRRRAHRSSDRAGRSASRARGRARRRSPRRRAASVTAVGRPRATSAAKLGPDRIAGIAPGMRLGDHLGHESVRAALDALGAGDHRRACRDCGASARRDGAQVLRRHQQQDRISMCDIRESVGRTRRARRSARRAGAGFRASPRWLGVRDRAPTASRCGRRAQRVRQRVAPGAAPTTAMRCSHEAACATAARLGDARRHRRAASARAAACRACRSGRAQAARARPGDHRAVVGAQLRRRHHQHGADLERDPVQRLRIAWLAATPPARDQRGRRADSARGTASCRRAAGRRPRRRPPAGTTRRGRATSWSLIGAIFSASSRSAVFSPESEKSASARPAIGRGSAKRSASPLLRFALDLRVRRDSRGRAALRSCRRPRRWRRRQSCRAARNRRRRAPRRSGYDRRTRGTGNRGTACRRSAAPSARALRDD